MDINLNNFNNIDGWCRDAWLNLVPLLNNICEHKDKNIAEIGVHHGKFFILLNHYNDNCAYAVDLFDDQELNIDKSGKGNLSKFRNNLLQYDKHQGNNVTIIKGDTLDYSLDLPNKIGKGSCKFLSVDGGHTVHHILNDLKLAEQLISNSGFVFVDDFLNPHWLEVTEGIYKYLNNHGSLVPLCFGHNKLIMCKLSFKDKYLSLLKDKKVLNKKFTQISKFQVGIIN